MSKARIDTLKYKKVAVLMGGLSSEREISLKTGAAVLGALARLGIPSVSIDAGRDVCEQIKKSGAHVAFIALHGRYGEDGCIQGALEAMGVPYTASGVAASAIAMNKRLTKMVCQSIGVATPGYRVIGKNDADRETAIASLAAPVVIKPSVGGSSIGVTVCLSGDKIADAVERAFGEYHEMVAEDFVEGALITVGVLGDMALPAVEIETTGGFYDYTHKYTPGSTHYHIPARLADGSLQEAARMTLAVHGALGCKGATRSEFIVDRAGKPWFLELNTIPGMTETSLLPKEAAAVGLSFDDLVLTILMEALADDR
ncbi:MAG: D-alanine--D-alanine ligase [Nitrospinae bacterium]|nr:D-alanine--D-alanine ligase [Nitrospinota bacterium]